MKLRGVVAVFIFAGIAAGCASSSSRATCDPQTGSNCEVDAGLPGEASVDGAPKRGFGEECTDRDQCESDLCVHVGTSGVCTMTCGECPDGWGCLGVTGVDIDGQVTFVCVPESNQLCTPCTQHSECSYVGMDLCVAYDDGDKYCSRSCETVTCPTGYDCETINVGGTNYEQCMPASGACDCSATNPGQMQPCNIVTPFGVCIGAQTCGGASGWGACEPPSPVDDPDAGYEDSNCDGIDGDMERAIFVAGGGVNSGSCGLVYTNPCQTIPFAMSRAQAAGRPHIYVQSGTYNGSLTMVAGISIFGGYDFNWQRAPHSDPGHGVTITGGVIGVRFDAITQPTWLDNVIVQSANATAAGASSIGVLVTGSTGIELRGVLVDPGAGAPGNPGNDGFVGGGGGVGGTGTPGCEDSGTGCGDCPQPAVGTRGASPCGRLGGLGGVPGKGGNNGAYGGEGINEGWGGQGSTCHSSRACDGTVGTPGAYGGPGTNGSGGLAIGTFSGSSYFPSAGTLGVTGGHGNGGGGGGGGGGGTNFCDSYGSSGGGGGGGGCGGGGGTGGTGGGGSFGVIAYNSQLVIDSATVMGRTGGAGGRGGTGGSPGTGGTGGWGGAYGGDDEQDDGGDGARGGRGGDGGRGGHGGGGGGGPSIAVVCLGTSTGTASALASTLVAGTGGLGGSSGAPGQNGLSAMTHGCPF
jgi:hypothetical protein